MKITAIVIFSITMSFALAALAQTAGEQPAQAIEREVVVYQKVQFMDFLNTEPIRGEIVAPNNSFLPVKPGATFKVLVPVRADFLPEIAASAEGL